MCTSSSKRTHIYELEQGGGGGGVRIHVCVCACVHATYMYMYVYIVGHLLIASLKHCDLILNIICVNCVFNNIIAFTCLM